MWAGVPCQPSLWSLGLLPHSSHLTLGTALPPGQEQNTHPPPLPPGTSPKRGSGHAGGRGSWESPGRVADSPSQRPCQVVCSPGRQGTKGTLRTHSQSRLTSDRIWTTSWSPEGRVVSSGGFYRCQRAVGMVAGEVKGDIPWAEGRGGEQPALPDSGPGSVWRPCLSLSLSHTLPRCQAFPAAPSFRVSGHLLKCARGLVGSRADGRQCTLQYETLGDCFFLANLPRRVTA